MADAIEHADALYIAGGNQNDYINYWKGTPVEAAINDDIAKGDPLGGTSAGIAVMGQFLYSAEGKSLTSDEALTDPYGPNVTLDRDFVNIPLLADTITDTHFVAQDRMGRLVTFLARTQADGWSDAPKGIGINEKTALLVTPDGKAQVVDNSQNPPGTNTTSGASYAYFLRPEVINAVVQPKTPLTYQDVEVQRVAAGGTFDLTHWAATPDAASSETTYRIAATNGVLATDPPGGSIY